jgi:hypothetical protein
MMTTTTNYAAGTSVSVDKSKAELDRMLTRAGAASVFLGADSERGEAFAGFRLAERNVCVKLPLPKRDDPRFRRVARNGRRPDPTALWEQACRERWRALVLLTKAKLEAIAIGNSTVEREFLADIHLRDGRTVHEVLRHDIARAFASGAAVMPAFQLGPAVRVEDAILEEDL